MAKFAVGDLVEVISCDVPNEQHFVGMKGEVVALGKWKRGDIWNGYICRAETGGEIAVRLIDGCFTGWHENELRKLPGDDAEDPGLTRLKKLLIQDAPKVKQPVKA